MTILIKFVIIELLVVLALSVYLDYDKTVNTYIKRCFNDLISLIRVTGIFLCIFCLICTVYIVICVIGIQKISNDLDWWTVFLNFAYSYISGFVVYVFTVSYPAWNRRKRMNENIKRMIAQLGTDITIEFKKIGLTLRIPTITMDECFEIIDNKYKKNKSLLLMVIEALKKINGKCDSFLLSYRDCLSEYEIKKLDNLKKVTIDALLALNDIESKDEIEHQNIIQTIVWVCILRYRELSMAFYHDLIYPEE